MYVAKSECGVFVCCWSLYILKYSEDLCTTTTIVRKADMGCQDFGEDVRIYRKTRLSSR